MADERPTEIDGAATRCDPEWCNLRDEAILIAKGVTFRTASRVALIVGILLTLVNQGSAIVDGDLAPTTWLRIAANFLIPYIVSSVGYLAPFRVRASVDINTPAP